MRKNFFYSGENKLTEILNPKILDKLKKIETNIHVKDFIKEMLFFELGHLEKLSRTWGTKYDNEIKKFALKYLKEVEEENEI
jgi:hypothetical protein